MTPAEALRDIRGYASAGRIAYTTHALERMTLRNVRRADVENALTNARQCRAAEQGRWKVTGPDIDSDALDLVVALADGVVVVTVF